MKTYPKGTVWLDREEDPTILYFQMPWINALAGNPKSPYVISLLDLLVKDLVFYPNTQWKKALRDKWGDKLVEFIHKTFRSDSLDLEHIQQYIADLPKGFTLERVDLDAAKYIEDNLHAFSRTWETVENYVKNGLGYCIKYGDIVASHAGSFFPFTDHLEIQVDTHPEYRGRGFATIVCAKLMEHCIENGVVPMWEAHTDISSKLAEKLGFTDPQTYDLFFKIE